MSERVLTNREPVAAVESPRSRTVSFGGAEHTFGVMPLAPGGERGAWRRAFAAGLLSSGIKRDAVMRASVHVRSTRDVADCRRELAESYDGLPPALDIVVQPALGGEHALALVWSVGGKGAARVTRPAPGVALLDDGEARWLFAQTERLAVTPGALSAADLERQLGGVLARLEEQGLALDDLVRTWIYVGGITDSEGGRQRYHLANEARQRFFAGAAGARPSAATAYPASTGIGTTDGGLCVGALAYRCDAAPPVRLENDCQVPAYRYPRSTSPAPPLFSRGVALRRGARELVLVSGTASIRGALSVHDDLAAQTEQTLDNIAHVLAAGGARGSLDDVVSAVVYVKRPRDYEGARRLCEARLPGAALAYVQADICRPELLVEVEAVALAALGPDGVRSIG